MNAPTPVTQFAKAAPPLTLEQACIQLESAKFAESEATLARLAAEQRVLGLVGELPSEGTLRRLAGAYVVVVQTSIRRTVNADKIAEIAKDIPEAIGKRLLRWEPTVNTRELRYVQANEPEIYSILAQAIEAKPAKPAVKVEPAKEAA